MEYFFNIIGDLFFGIIALDLDKVKCGWFHKGTVVDVCQVKTNNCHDRLTFTEDMQSPCCRHSDSTHSNNKRLRAKGCSTNIFRGINFYAAGLNLYTVYLLFPYNLYVQNKQLAPYQP